MGTPADELLRLAAALRVAVPRHAPLHVAELVQHCVVRLEHLARVSATEPARQAQQRHAEQLLQLCQSYTAEPVPGLRFDD